ncbi:fluoride efflux transporter CrcB [Wenxinia saemankumensis]|nr:fluoride efflux transporter CrcB [Wenxinia saemankumensis]
MIQTFLQVGAGGALGAMARFALGLGVVRLTGPNAPFPVAVLGANVIGSFAMGMLVVALAEKGGAHLSPFLVTGLLGGFTTFSSFSLEAATLWERGAPALAATYVALSVGLSLAGIASGLVLGRGIFA